MSRFSKREFSWNRRVLWILIPIWGIIFLLFVQFGFNRIPVSRLNSSSDSLIDHLPAAIFLRNSVLEQHQFPLWRETILNGQPFAGISLYKTAYPLQWLLLVFDPVAHISLMIVLHAVLAGIGMALWTKAHRLSTEACAFATLAFVFTPIFVVDASGQLDLVYAFAWLPWLMTAAKYWVDRTTLLNMLLLVLFASLMLLADIRISFFGYLLVGSYIFYEILRRRQAARLIWGIPIALAVLILTSSVIVPFLQWRQYIIRAQMTVEEATNSAFDLLSFVSALAPVPFINVLYLGLPVLQLAFLAVLSEWRAHLYWILVAGFVVLYGMGANSFFWLLLVQVFPALLWFRIPSRSWYLIAFCVPFLAGQGIQRLLDLRQQVPTGVIRVTMRYRRVLQFIIPVTILAIIIPFTGLVPPVHFQTFSISLLIGGSVGSFLILKYLRGKLTPRVFVPLLMLVVFIDLASVEWTYLRWRGEDIWLEPYRPLAEKLVSTQAYRIYETEGGLLPQHVAEIYALRLSGGISPFIFSGVAEAVAQGGGFELPSSYIMGLPVTSKDELLQHPNTAILGEWRVTHLLSKSPITNAYLELIDMLNGVYVYANRDPHLTIPPDPLTHWPQGWAGLPANSLIEQINRLTVYTHAISFSGLALLVLSIAILSLRQRKFSVLPSEYQPTNTEAV